MAKTDFESLARELDNYYEWPVEYYFKFIVPNTRMLQFEKLFAEYELTSRPSRKGKYVGVTIKKIVASSREVIEIYKLSESIEGIMSL